MGEEAQAEFGQYLGTVYQYGCIMHSVALGHDLGLFKVICAATEPMSLEEIADKLDLKERYTKEWLSGMVAAGMIHQDRDSNLYSVPDANRPALIGQTAMSSMVVHIGKRVESIKKCFKKDGPWGIPFNANPEFFDWLHDLRVSKCDNIVNNELIPQWEKMPGLVQKLETGIKVVDLGCGSGNFTNSLAQRFPNSTFIGLDFSQKGIEIANEIRESKGLANASFVVGNAHNLPEEWNNTVDVVLMFDVLHDLPNPHKCLGEIFKVLKDGGCLTIVELDFHSNPVDNANNKAAAMIYACSTFVCLPSGLSEEPRAGKGACWGVESIQKAIENENFTVVVRSKLTPKGMDSVFLCTK